MLRWKLCIWRLPLRNHWTPSGHSSCAWGFVSCWSKVFSRKLHIPWLLQTEWKAAGKIISSCVGAEEGLTKKRHTVICLALNCLTWTLKMDSQKRRVLDINVVCGATSFPKCSKVWYFRVYDPCWFPGCTWTIVMMRVTWFFDAEGSSSSWNFHPLLGWWGGFF